MESSPFPGGQAAVGVQFPHLLYHNREDNVETVRCFGQKPGPMREYHDREWGVPVRDERKMFELLILEGAQAGLSWETILKRREGYRRAFKNFDPEVVARFGEADKARLLADPGIIRNRLKVEAAVTNARAALELREAGSDLAAFLWSFVGGVPLAPRFAEAGAWPAETPLSRDISKALRARGFRFVGPVIVYAHMQSAGMTNDHPVSCFRHAEVAALSGGGR